MITTAGTGVIAITAGVKSTGIRRKITHFVSLRNLIYSLLYADKKIWFVNMEAIFFVSICKRLPISFAL